MLYLSEQSSPSDVFDVLEPLEVADGDSSSVAEHIRQEADSFFEEDVLALASGWPVSSLNDEFALELVSVVKVDGLLEGRGDENVTK